MRLAWPPADMLSTEQITGKTNTSWGLLWYRSERDWGTLIYTKAIPNSCLFCLWNRSRESWSERRLSCVTIWMRFAGFCIQSFGLISDGLCDPRFECQCVCVCVCVCSLGVFAVLPPHFELLEVKTFDRWLPPHFELLEVKHLMDVFTQRFSTVTN